MANDPQSIDIDVSVQMTDGDPFATWSFGTGRNGLNATRVTLYSGEQYHVTYQLRDEAFRSWKLEAVSLRRVSDDHPNTGFVTLDQGQTTEPYRLPDGAGSLTVEKFSPRAVTLHVTNALTGSESLTVGLSLTVSARHSPTTPKQSSQDPQMILEPNPPPPPIL